MLQNKRVILGLCLFMLILLLLFFPVSRFQDEVRNVENPSSMLLPMLIDRRDLRKIDGLEMQSGIVGQENGGLVNNIEITEQAIYMVNTIYSHKEQDYPVTIEERILISRFNVTNPSNYFAENENPIKRFEIQILSPLLENELAECFEYTSSFGECHVVSRIEEKTMTLRLLFLKLLPDKVSSELMNELFAVSAEKIKDNLKE